MAPSINTPEPTISKMKAPFTRANLCLNSDSSEDGVHSLPDLIQFNAEQNPDHLFAIQELKVDQDRQLERVTFRSLHQAVLACREWISAICPPTEEKKPVGLFLESDLGLFIYLSALLSLEIPVLLLSARLGPAAINHLVTKTGASAILVSKRTASQAAQATTTNPIQILHGRPFSDFLSQTTTTQLPRVPSHPDEPGSLILHSSGTTGLPKPIFLTHRYILGYAACHRLSPDQSVGRVNVSTLPLYHGFGLLAPCLSLSAGKPCAFPSPATIPSATSTLSLLQSTAASSLMTVPSIIEEIASFPTSSSLSTLKPLDFIAVGGGAIKPETGERLHSAGVSLLNHYGATEIGAIAPIFIPDKTYDWHYLRLRSDLGLRVRDVDDPGEGKCKLVGYPFGWGVEFEVQDLLERNPHTAGDEIEVRVLGRKDDVIVLATGEKVVPQLVEERLTQTEGVKTAVVFGEGRETVGVLIETEGMAESKYDDVIERVWPVIDEVNRLVDRHARIPSREAVVVVSREKAIPRSDKGSVMRNEVSRVFADEIESMYSLMGKWTVDNVSIDPVDPVPGLRELIQCSLGDRIQTSLSADSDFFELGMDSLEATRLARTFNALPNKASFPGLSDEVRPDFVYQHPTLASLAGAMIGRQERDSESQRALEMQTMLQDALDSIRTAGNAVILLTGSTGTLGVHLLNTLARNPRVKGIICLNRPLARVSPSAQQEVSFQAKGVQLPPDTEDKITYIQTTTHDHHLGLPEDVYTTLTTSVTHIIHNAWPMDFKRQLSSFRNPIQSVSNLIKLSQDIHALRPHVIPRLLFTSSIAVTGRYPGKQVSEQRMTDPNWTVPMGYAEAKWVCEGLLDDAAQLDPGTFHPAIVRLGQLSGSTASGFWTQAEHLPTLFSTSMEIGALPDIKGTYSWLPVDTAARVLAEITLSDREQRFYHVENPIRQPWADLLTALRVELGLGVVGFEEWMARAGETDRVTSLEGFFREDFQTLASGPIILRTDGAREVSRTLRSCGGVGREVVRRYLVSWREEGVL